MTFKDTIQTSTKALRVHKVRSFLTILGIVIGISSIVIVMSLGRGAEALIVDQVNGLGPETVVLRPGGGIGDMTTLYSQSITKKDLTELQKPGNVPNLVSVEPFVMIGRHIEYKGKKYRPTILGASAEFVSEIYDIDIREGDLYRKSDIDSNARVAVIGYELKQEIFGSQNAIGESIKIKDTKFEIVAVFDDTPPATGFDMNESVLIPYSTALTYITGGDFYNEVIIRGNSAEEVEKMAFDIEATIRETHNLSSDEKNDFTVQTQEQAIAQIESIISILTAFLAMVVAVSLVVGGVGIMNIMLVSVTERTQEIGLRKALGAKRSDILKQFLYEAVILTSIGGIIGILIGVLVSFSASLILAKTVNENWRFVFPLGASILAVGVSAAVGLAFGIYPASQASKKSPIEALRYE